VCEMRRPTERGVCTVYRQSVKVCDIVGPIISNDVARTRVIKLGQDRVLSFTTRQLCNTISTGEQSPTGPSTSGLTPGFRGPRPPNTRLCVGPIVFSLIGLVISKSVRLSVRASNFNTGVFRSSD